MPAAAEHFHDDVRVRLVDIGGEYAYDGFLDGYFGGKNTVLRKSNFSANETEDPEGNTAELLSNSMTAADERSLARNLGEYRVSRHAVDSLQ